MLLASFVESVVAGLLFIIIAVYIVPAVFWGVLACIKGFLRCACCRSRRKLAGSANGRPRSLLLRLWTLRAISLRSTLRATPTV